MKKVIILFALVSIIFADFQYYKPTFEWKNRDKIQEEKGPNKRVPFPQCLLSGTKSKSFEAAFNRNIEKEMQSLFNIDESTGTGKGRRKADPKSIAATAAIKLTRDIMTALACDLNGTDTANLHKFLNKFTVPQQLCSYHEKPSCEGKRKFRTSDGLCNNEDHPYWGNAKTAFGRILGAGYEDFLSQPRQTGYNGELLPSCRAISLALGSEKLYDKNFNNLFSMFGQLMENDMSFATPATETDLSPLTSCSCASKNETDRCHVIDVEKNDPYMNSQQCMVFPATAQAFKDQVCSLGVKEQMNGNTHFLDLSTLYGSTLQSALTLRADNGLMKSSARYWLKNELPPYEYRPKSCTDATPKRPCFAGGDSRLMENLLLTGVNTMFLRFHNQLAKKIGERQTNATTHQIYEITRQFTTDLYQSIVYGYWIPKLLGPKYGQDLLDSIITNGYNKTVSPVVYNEVGTAAFRLSSLARDQFSRCTKKGKAIDEVSFLSISHKSKHAYDVENNGMDSILCGSLYDYGMAYDGNFATQLHHQLYESRNRLGYLWRNDIVAINICRGREHGIRSYNAYRQYCDFPKARQFKDFRDTMSRSSIKKLKQIYQNPNDVDLFVGLNLEEPVQGGVVGPVSACLIAEQFRVLCEGDRFCAAHRFGLSKEELQKLGWTGLAYLTCQTVDVEQVPLFPFRPPNQVNNPLVNCSIFQAVDKDFADKAISLNKEKISPTNKMTAALFKVSLDEYLLKPGFYDYQESF